MASPALPDRPGSVWSRFPLDPRSSGDLRAGDADRETAREVLAEAYTDGRLSREDYDQRIEATLTAQHLGQLVPLLNDVSVSVARPGSSPRLEQTIDRPAPSPRGSSSPARRGFINQGPIRSAIFVVGVTNLVWLLTSINSGQLQYYWPMWPALGMAIMVLATVLFRGDDHKSGRERGRDHRHVDPRNRRELE